MGGVTWGEGFGETSGEGPGFPPLSGAAVDVAAAVVESGRAGGSAAGWGALSSPPPVAVVAVAVAEAAAMSSRLRRSARVDRSSSCMKRLRSARSVSTAAWSLSDNAASVHLQEHKNTDTLSLLQYTYKTLHSGLNANSK